MLEVIGLHEYALITAFRAVFGGPPDRTLLLKRGHPAHDSERFAVITATTPSAVSIPVEVVPPASHQFAYADCLHRYGSISAPQRGREAVARDGDVTGQAGSRHRLVRQLGLHRRSLRDPRALPLGASDGLANAVYRGTGAVWANAGVADEVGWLQRSADDPLAQRTLGVTSQVMVRERLGVMPRAAAVRSLRRGGTG